jgi:hypothetical protein
MGAAGLELPEWITRTTVERAHGLALRAQKTQALGFAEKGMRAARARDPHMMKALEGGAEMLLKISREQLGSNYVVAGVRLDATEHSIWREAYVQADRGAPLVQFRWIYGAAAELAGL